MENQTSSLTIDQPVRIHLIGKFRVYGIDDIDITPTATKARCLLAVLIVENSGTVSREKISQLLWSRHAHEQARASLRQSLCVLRRIFDKIIPGFISADRHNIHIQLNNAWIDARKIIDGNAKRSPLIDKFNGEVLGELNANDPEFSRWLALRKLSLLEEISHALTRDTAANVNQKSSDEIQAYSPFSHAAPLPMQQKNEDDYDRTSTEKIAWRHDQRLYRTSLLKKVKAFWIDGLLVHSLGKKTVIAPALKEVPEHVYQPWKSIITHSHHQTRIFPDNTPIVDIFEALHKNMLILGSPGSGKTTLLLNLAKKLLARAEEDEHTPIPVVFHLSTWNNQYISLDDWLIDELENRYQMPRELNIEMSANHALLLLLDGLDEVDVNCRVSCIKAINKFQNQSRPVSMAICSREDDYTNFSPPLALENAIVIQPLKPQQLNLYLQTNKASTHGLNSAIAHNPGIKRLLTTPLMLHIATTAYQYYHKGCLLNASSQKSVRDQLFAAYVQTMFQHRNKNLSYTPAQTTHWLGCLARTLLDKKQSLFYLDDIQPDWAETPRQHWIITKGSIYICGLIVISMLGLLSTQHLATSTNFPLFLIIGFIGCYFTARWGYGDNIKPVVHMQLSLSALRYQFPFKLMSSAALATALGGGATLLLSPTIGITLGGIFFLLLIVTHSLNVELTKRDQQQPSPPNGAIHASLYNAFIGMVSGSMLGGISVGLFNGSLQDMILTGITLGVISGLSFGGHACIQHYLLRYFLWRNKTAPLRYTPFLEFAANRVFLYRIGSGYIFIHRSLAEYFAKNF